MDLQLEIGWSSGVKAGFIGKPMSRWSSSQPGPPVISEHGMLGWCLKLELERLHKLLQKWELQSDHSWNQWDKVDSFQSAEACYWGVGAVLRQWKRQCTTHLGCVSKTVQRALTGWEAHGPRILKAKKQTINMDVILCYAPTNDSNEDVEEEFYSWLSTIIQNCPRRNITIMMRDFNAKTGSDNRGYEEIMGQHKLWEINDNGERFADLCTLNHLVILPALKGDTTQLGYCLTCQQRTR